jgi:hypothetical protein
MKRIWLIGSFSLVNVIVFLTAIFHAADNTNPTPAGRKEFEGWTKPKAALFLTGRQHGYIEPCGCTGLDNQKGGLARRHTLLKMFLSKKWNILPLDVGNQIRRTGVQPEMMLHSTLEGLRLMRYEAVGLGPDDLRLSTNGLMSAIVAKTDQEGKSDLFVSANVNVLGFARTHHVAKVGDMRIGITAILGSEYVKAAQNDELTLEDPEEALSKVIPQLLAQKCDVLVLLAYASLEESRALAKRFTDLHLVVSAGANGEPTFMPEQIPGTKAQLIQTGTKGMYVGIAGFFDDPAHPIRYQRISLDKRFADSPDMLSILKDYQDKLRMTIEQQGLGGLGLEPVIHPRGHEFVGSEVCGECHTTAHGIWENTPHRHATDSISQPRERSEIPRHFDPECLSCHVTGWNPQQFFPYTGGYLELVQSAHLHSNGCENCHGPGSAHVAAENGLAELSPERKKALRLEMRLTLDKARDTCLECHDLDNSPDFHHDGAFEKYWERIKHKGLD